MNGEKTTSRNIRIGAVVAASFLTLMLFLFFIGAEQKLFARKNEYEVRLQNVTGLADGNPVKLSGVTIGVVKDIRLPQSPAEKDVHIILQIDRKYSERIRLDSRARLKKLGLLAGDSYLDITPGSPKFPEIKSGAIIPSQRATDVDALIASGGDLVDNFVQISYSLRNILGRVDRGEGLLGELTSTPATKQKLTETMMVTLNRTNALLDHIQSGKGLAGKLLYDDAYGAQVSTSLNSSIQSVQSVMENIQRSFETGSGALPMLLNDPDGKAKLVALIENLRITSEKMAAFSEGLETGAGLVPRLINDKEFADETLVEFRSLVRELNETARKLNHGEGTAGKLIADPAIYESINDILIGLNESKLLRWLVRNRQKAGIEKRYGVEQKVVPAPPVKKISTPPVVEEVPQSPPVTTPPPAAETTTASPSVSDGAPPEPATDPPPSSMMAPPEPASDPPPSSMIGPPPAPAPPSAEPNP